MARDCEPATLLNLFPCLECASDDQLDMVWLYLWAYFGGYDLSEDLDEILANGVALAEMSETDIKRMKVATFAEFLGVTNLTDILDDVKCLPCAKPALIRGATMWLICDFLNAQLD